MTFMLYASSGAIDSICKVAKYLILEKIFVPFHWFYVPEEELTESF